MTKLSRLVLLGLLTFSIPAAWAEDTPASAAAAAQTAAPAAEPAAKREFLRQILHDVRNRKAGEAYLQKER